MKKMLICLLFFIPVLCFSDTVVSQEKLLETIIDIKKISELTGYTTDYIITRFFKQPRMGTDKLILVIEDLDKNIALKAIEKINSDRIDILEYIY